MGHLSPTFFLAYKDTNVTILKSHEYPLSTLTLSYAECNKKVMAIVKKDLLNSSGMCTSIPKSVLHGPIYDGSFGLNHLYVTRGGIFHIENFMKFIAVNTMTGKLLQVTLQLGILEVFRRLCFQL